MKKSIVALLMGTVLSVTGCGDISNYQSQMQENRNTLDVTMKLVNNQPTPTDIDYSLQRYLLIKRAYWVNGQREKALQVTAPFQVPIGYITLFTEQGQIIGQFTVDGKVSTLNSYLTPDSEVYASGSTVQWLPDVDGSYGENDPYGIFFFTPDGKYIEWTGDYLYSDIPFDAESTILKKIKE